MIRLLRDWHYSWSDSRTEASAKMETSVSLFLEFLKSNLVATVLTKDDINEIFKMTRESILALEEYFCFHWFSGTRCYDARTTSGHEGTNHALKHGSTAVRPDQSLEKMGQ